MCTLFTSFTSLDDKTYSLLTCSGQVICYYYASTDSAAAAAAGCGDGANSGAFGAAARYHHHRGKQFVCLYMFRTLIYPQVFTVFLTCIHPTCGLRPVTLAVLIKSYPPLLTAAKCPLVVAADNTPCSTPTLTAAKCPLWWQLTTLHAVMQWKVQVNAHTAGFYLLVSSCCGRYTWVISTPISLPLADRCCLWVRVLFVYKRCV